MDLKDLQVLVLAYCIVGETSIIIIEMRVRCDLNHLPTCDLWSTSSESTSSSEETASESSSSSSTAENKEDRSYQLANQIADIR